MKVLVLNCGSSSIKYQLIKMNNEADVLAKGLLERVGMDNSELTHQPKGKDKVVSIQPVHDHTVGINLILDALMHPEHGVIKDKYEIDVVGHRVVHGGEKFSGSVLITQEVIDKMEECSDLAPLHNPANLKGIYAIQKLLPEVKMCGVFDTAFHQTMPEHSYLYALPYEFYEKYKVRRYGFHGTSHGFVAQKACKILGMDFNNVNIITCHLGNGASITAIKNGKSYETSMGLTPVEGLIMGTRCGDLDLGALLFLMEKENLDLKKTNDIINKKSGMMGLSGVSSDMRDIEDAAKKGNHRAQLSLKMYNHRVKKYIGAYAAVMGGVDLIIFTGGIGENASNTRSGIMEGLEFLGINFDFELNKNIHAKDATLTKEDSKVKVMVITTNEELVIANESIKLISN
ncbi:MAG: acetate kinase [Bacteroidales bacterium]|jgi:acetate kinase|nr:acetate kinase [Bacteroidales bacterium]MDD4215395.1 acetate kinase [Bacteroidales bacterium]